MARLPAPAHREGPGEALELAVLGVGGAVRAFDQDFAQGGVAVTGPAGAPAFPHCSLFPGHTPAHAAQCRRDGKARMSGPNSTTMALAE